MTAVRGGARHPGSTAFRASGRLRLAGALLLCALAGAAASATAAAAPGPGAPGSRESRAATHDVTFAPHLPTAVDFTGSSIRDTRLSRAAYVLSKRIGSPRLVDVACWSKADWRVIGGGTDSAYSTTAFWSPRMPHWVNLSPEICGAMETLLEHRPRYANVFTADAVQTLTHEMMHAIGIRNEAQAECFSMQVSALTAEALGVPGRYALGLARLNLDNYPTRPPSYIDTTRCREDGAWDLFKGQDSPPWHTLSAPAPR